MTARNLKFKVVRFIRWSAIKPKAPRQELTQKQCLTQLKSSLRNTQAKKKKVENRRTGVNV